MKADTDEQKRLIPALEYDEHSGNTLMCACGLAIGCLEYPDVLWKFHGALCPLVGCVDYGCHAGQQVN